MAGSINSQLPHLTLLADSDPAAWPTVTAVQNSLFKVVVIASTYTGMALARLSSTRQLVTRGWFTAQGITN